MADEAFVHALEGNKTLQLITENYEAVADYVASNFEVDHE